MCLLVRGLFVSLLFLAVSARHQGWDDKNCTELYQAFVDAKLFPKHDRTQAAFCSNQIDGEYLESFNDDELCSEGKLNLNSADCDKVRNYLSAIKAMPSYKFKDFWDWRAHNKRLSDYWLLPLSQCALHPVQLLVTSSKTYVQFASLAAFLPLFSEQRRASASVVQ